MLDQGRQTVNVLKKVKVNGKWKFCPAVIDSGGKLRDKVRVNGHTEVHPEAAATDLRLRPLRGKVEGRKRGRNILVRSAAGVGEVVATLAGRGSIDQPLSEGDLLRERVSNNVAQASDQEINRLAVTEHLVVSVPADTEIYIVLQKPAKGLSAVRSDNARSQVPTASQRNVDQLRQLLQLQKELNQEAVAVNVAQ